MTKAVLLVVALGFFLAACARDNALPTPTGQAAPARADAFEQKCLLGRAVNLGNALELLDTLISPELSL